MSSTTLNKMSHMKLLGMLRSYQSMLNNRIHDGLTHDEVVDTLIQAEWEDRETKKINRHLNAQGSAMERLLKKSTLPLNVAWIKPRCFAWLMEPSSKKRKTY